MDLKSFTRWDEYTRARDEMFSNTDSPWAPWFVARSEDKRRVRLNVISHMLKRLPYEDITKDEKIKLPKRGKIGSYKEINYPFKYVDEVF
ncbi:Polyphosphate kinase 2 [compost metagenome]